MPIYISRGRFTSDAVKGMLAKPENGEEAVAKLFKSALRRYAGQVTRRFGGYRFLINDYTRRRGFKMVISASFAARRLIRTRVGALGSLDRRLGRRDDDCFAPRSPTAQCEGRGCELRGVRTTFRISGPHFDPARRPVRRLHAGAARRLESLPICLVLVARPHGRRPDAIRAYDLRAGTARDSPTLPRICSTQQGSRLRGGDRTWRSKAAPH
jgi:hypothetical protein